MVFDTDADWKAKFQVPLRKRPAAALCHLNYNIRYSFFPLTSLHCILLGVLFNDTINCYNFVVSVTDD
jgi:hypothetical protein